MNTEKIEKLKKGLTNSQIPETLREKIRQQISRLEAEDKANEAPPKEEAPKEEAPKAEATPKKEPAPKKARAPRVAKAPTVRKPRAKKVVEPKTHTTGKNTAMALAKEIRKDGEKWTDAVKRASSEMKKGTKQIKKSTNTELKKLLALVKKRKELKGISGTDLKRDSRRKAKPRGSRTVTHSGETTNQYGTFDNKLGRKYSENRDNRTDRLAPKYPKNAPLLAGGGGVWTEEQSLKVAELDAHFERQLKKLGIERNSKEASDFWKSGGFQNRMKKIFNKEYELGGGVDATMTYDLAGNTSGGTGGLNAGMPLSDVSGTNYTGLVGETGAMSAGEMFANGGGLPSGAMQSYVNNYLGEGTAQGIYKNGGGVESVPRIEYIEFVDYVNEFYGKNGIYADQLNGGFTKSQIKVAVVKYFSTFNKNRTWGGGDSLDRERVREILDPSYKMEHGGKMHDYKKMEDDYANGGFMNNVYAGGGSVGDDYVLIKATSGYSGYKVTFLVSKKELEKIPYQTMEEKAKAFVDNVTDYYGDYAYNFSKLITDKKLINEYAENYNHSNYQVIVTDDDDEEYPDGFFIIKSKDYLKFASGGGTRTVNGRQYPLGRNWTNDHRQHNKAQDYEVPKNNRK